MEIKSVNNTPGIWCGCYGGDGDVYVHELGFESFWGWSFVSSLRYGDCRKGMCYFCILGDYVCV